MDLNPSAAPSLGEGMEETLTELRLSRADETAEDHGQHERDRVGNLDSRTGMQEHETVARQRPAGALGWVGALGRGKAFRRGHGYKQFPALIKELEASAPSNSPVVKQRKASESGLQGSPYFHRNSGHYLLLLFVAFKQNPELPSLQLKNTLESVDVPDFEVPLKKGVFMLPTVRIDTRSLTFTSFHSISSSPKRLSTNSSGSSSISTARAASVASGTSVSTAVPLASIILRNRALQSGIRSAR